ncbi:MAG TPA: LuxR C-terminal-related transcriptional regulator [Candidatus Acidoferrum sp.]|nr:LuxR C-terminal-related transcriptional regulator [Candidatus Acidoferrum sp.]
MKKAPAVPKLIARFKKQEVTRTTSLVFCEKSTGVAQFEVGYGFDLDSDIERTASLLAMQCLVRGCEPCDYAILVPAEKAVAGRVTERAKELLDAGVALANPVLSPRQMEILRAVARNSANKEIAGKFNITVRTVKFHVSTLLSKFGVDNRVELAQKAARFLRPAGAAGESLEAHPPIQRRGRELLDSITFEQNKTENLTSHNASSALNNAIRSRGGVVSAR